MPSGYWPTFDRYDSARRRCVYRGAEFSIRFCDQLSFEYVVANAYHGLGWLPDVLLDREDQLRRDGYVQNWLSRGRLFMPRQTQAAVQPAEIIGGCTHDNGLIVMQSTGQGATHSSQPVHSLAMTVCMNWCAPTIASTGQALRQW